jgi:Mg/Co/Ni transporter MgtE
MSTGIVCASGEETLLEAFELAYSSKMRDILIVSKHGIRAVSITAFAKVPRSRWEMTKIKSLSTAVPRCRPDEKVLQAWKKMRAFHVRIAPVVEGGRLIGVVTEEDIEKLIHLKKTALLT